MIFLKGALDDLGELQVFDLSVIGDRHVKKKAICQDSALSYCDDKMGVAIVCDGHGGKKYFRSHRGAKLAAETTLKAILDLMRCEDQMNGELSDNPDQVLEQLEQKIIENWNQAVNQDVEKNPFSEAELMVLYGADRLIFEHKFEVKSAYGTTIIAFVISPEFCFGLQIGDGKCCAIDLDGKVFQPIPWDNNCILNVTTSIINDSALANFRHYFSESLPVAVYVGTDGIDDSFADIENLYDFYRQITRSFTTLEFDKVVNQLSEFLSKLSETGSGDDVSLAAILNSPGNDSGKNC